MVGVRCGRRARRLPDRGVLFGGCRLGAVLRRRDGQRPRAGHNGRRSVPRRAGGGKPRTDPAAAGRHVRQSRSAPGSAFPVHGADALHRCARRQFGHREGRHLPYAGVLRPACRAGDLWRDRRRHRRRGGVPVHPRLVETHPRSHELGAWPGAVLALARRGRADHLRLLYQGRQRARSSRSPIPVWRCLPV